MYIDEDSGWEFSSFNRPVVTNRIGSERKFGVELEYNYLPDDVFDLEGRTVFGAKQDCSVDGGEFYSPILYGDHGLGECEKFCEQAKAMGFRAEQGAGFHLHIDMRGESVVALKSIALAYHYTQKFWLALVEPYRRNYTYSHPHHYNEETINNIPETDREWRNFAQDYGRYNWANWLAFGDHGSLELRPHESTVESDDVVHWVIGHTRFADAVKDMSVGQITRIFGRFGPGGNVQLLFREMRSVIRNVDTSEHFAQRYRRWATAA